MAEIKSESVVDFIPESVADFPQDTQLYPETEVRPTPAWCQNRSFACPPFDHLVGAVEDRLRNRSPSAWAVLRLTSSTNRVLAPYDIGKPASYGRSEFMEWCEEHRVDFIFGLPSTAVLYRAVDETADFRSRPALDQKPGLRGVAATSYRARSWKTERRSCARIEAATTGLDIRLSRRNGSRSNYIPGPKSGVDFHEALSCAMIQKRPLLACAN